MIEHGPMCALALEALVLTVLSEFLKVRVRRVYYRCLLAAAADAPGLLGERDR